MPVMPVPPAAVGNQCPDCDCICAEESSSTICRCSSDRCETCNCGVAPCAECSCPCDSCQCGTTVCSGCNCGQIRCRTCQCRCTDCNCRHERCSSCDCDRVPQQLIHNYSTRVERRLKFQGKPNDRLVPATGLNMRDTTFFGVELEVEVGRSMDVEDAARKTYDLIGRDFVMLKSDGSIHRGFEIVSAPATLEVHREKWTPFLTKKPGAIKSWDTSTCGMHVHMTRPTSVGRGSLHLGKMLVFINDLAHREQIVAISGRQSHWGKFSNRRLSDGKANSYIETGRYSALNITNDKTLEVRMFRGTASLTGFMKNLEFCHAMFYFTRDTSMRSLDWSSFVAFVKERRSEYPALVEFIEDRLEDDTARLARIKVVEKRNLDHGELVIAKMDGSITANRVTRRLARARSAAPVAA